ncbi:MAG: hypothetical protein ACLFO3_06290 [Candidatus Acetothermia bacterium]
MNSEKEINDSRYVEAIESVLEKIPIKNRKVSIHAIHLETSLPYDLLEELLEEKKVEYPDNLDKIIFD